jgi:uncharacterized protein YbjT (DUF2867 family)
VNTVTGEGVADALAGAEVLVDVSNSPSFEEEAVLEFFTTSTRTLLDAARTAGIRHYVALSIVGTDRLPDSPYLRAKVAQEELIRAGGVPYSIVHATQFYEFVRGIADSSTIDGVVRLPHAGIQPMASADVVAAVRRVALGAPTGGVVEIGGPDHWYLDDLVRTGLAFMGDDREVVTDAEATYFGAQLHGDELVPGAGAHLSTLGYKQWLPENPPPAR